MAIASPPAAADLGGGLFGRLAVPVDDRDLAAFLGEPDGAAAADARAGAGDRGDLALQTAHRHSFPKLRADRSGPAASPANLISFQRPLSNRACMACMASLPAIPDIVSSSLGGDQRRAAWRSSLLMSVASAFDLIVVANHERARQAAVGDDEDAIGGLEDLEHLGAENDQRHCRRGRSRAAADRSRACSGCRRRGSAPRAAPAAARSTSAWAIATFCWLPPDSERMPWAMLRVLTRKRLDRLLGKLAHALLAQREKRSRRSPARRGGRSGSRRRRSSSRG